MGQKVNPHGLRVGVIKDWDSKWYADHAEFGDNLVEDYNIRKFLKKKLFNAGVSKIEALLGETIVDQAAWNAADAELEAALVAAGVIEDEAPTAFENAITSVLKKINQNINKMFA